MQQNQCPTCQSDLQWDGQYFCSDCQQHYKKLVFCPECGNEVEKLKACGAVNYFCNTCNELKSKSKVKVNWEKV
ncbi:zinc ribbon domain-containing protein [Vibrio marisflavi]|uniref:DNA ligase n=1 Tax=Vibrio marisflavi CECT 7928 TaxID=634439 RepID=A0ABN8E1I5_9VIBR|nr:zinc ribbon domain-containing protein [Vibrio marisflavi]CAH0538834.1 putative protein YfgJ [Vibrio marisflavi CECT 7928]